MGWWQQWRRPAHKLDPESVLQALPKSAHSLIVHLGPASKQQPYYWQLRRRDGAADVALSVAVLPGRDKPLPLVPQDIEAFVQESEACHLSPQYLLSVAKADLTPGMLEQVAQGVPLIAGSRVFLVVSAQSLYDFTAGSQPSVGDLVDGLPMRDTSTLSAFVEKADPQVQAVHPQPAATTTVSYSHLKSADPAVVALFDLPMRQVADSVDAGTFMFTQFD